ncbi:MAG: hypothetical protein VYA69_01105 [Gemmatimonadota bacterium]|nr:hypothetical protein [Gemmatimonadota bacterium]
MGRDLLVIWPQSMLDGHLFHTEESSKTRPGHSRMHRFVATLTAWNSCLNDVQIYCRPLFLLRSPTSNERATVLRKWKWTVKPSRCNRL